MDHGRPTTPPPLTTEPPRDPNAVINEYLQVVKDCMFPPHIVARLPEEQRREIENMDVRIKSRPRGKVLGEVVTEDDNDTGTGTGTASGHAERRARRDAAAAAAARNNAPSTRCRDGESLRKGKTDVCARNLGVRQDNLRRTLVNLDAEIEPLFHISTGDVIEGFPRTLREVDLLHHGDAVRILEAVGEKERGGDLWTVVARVRRWAASNPLADEVLAVQGRSAKRRRGDLTVFK